MNWNNNIEEAPLEKDLLVKYEIFDKVYEYTCLERDYRGIWNWRGNVWDIENYPIIEWVLIEDE